jgi:hypothetical protein
MKEGYRNIVNVRITLKVVEIEGVKYMQIIEASGTAQTVEGALIPLDGEYHSIKVDYFSTTDIAIYVDDARVYLGKTKTANAQRHYMDTLTVTLGSGKSVSLDDIEFYDTEKVVPAATK